MAQPVCAIVGIGPGNGEAFARKFAAEGYQVALCSRNEARIEAVAKATPGAKAFVYDAADPEAAVPVFESIQNELGPVDALLYNAGSGSFISIDDSSLDDLRDSWEVNTQGLFCATKAVLPQMRRRGKGNIVVIGATASVRGGAKAAPFAAAKAAQRSLAQSMARQLGPEGIHVSYVVVDGVIDIPSTRKAMPDFKDDFFMGPGAIADSVYALTQQHASAWSFEIDLRPFGEKW
jgi:short-subunit dehydrogenase